MYMTKQGNLSVIPRCYPHKSASMSTILQVGVKALLKNKEGKFLLLQRSEEKYKGAGGMWDIPGGRIDPGTPLLENLKREIQEEAGLKLTREPQLIAAQDILRVPGKHVVRLTYIGSIDGQPTLSEEHTEFQWVTLKQLKELKNLDPYVKELISAGFIPRSSA